MPETLRLPETTDDDLRQINEANRRERDENDMAARKLSASYAETDHKKRAALQAEAEGHKAAAHDIRAEACERAAERYKGFRVGDSAAADGEWHRHNADYHRRLQRKHQRRAE